MARYSLPTGHWMPPSSAGPMLIKPGQAVGPTDDQGGRRHEYDYLHGNVISDR